MKRLLPLFVLLWAACPRTSPAQKVNVPMDAATFKSADEIRKFEARVGLRGLPQPVPGLGVAAAWNKLGATLEPFVANMKLEPVTTELSSEGLVTRQWTWKQGATVLNLSVHVSGSGVEPARHALVNVASVNMMKQIPFDKGPQGLGEVSIADHLQAPTTIAWVFHNATAVVRNFGSSVDLEPPARAVQRFMATNVVNDLAEHIPRLSVSLSSHEVDVGATVEMSVSVAGSGDFIGPEVVEQRPWRLEPMGASPPFRFRAAEPGQATLVAIVANASTLLAATAAATVKAVADSNAAP